MFQNFYVMFTILYTCNNGKLEVFINSHHVCITALLDDIGFSFIKKCIHAIEGRGKSVVKFEFGIICDFFLCSLYVS